MKILLDTHIWIWAFMRPEKVSRRLRRELDSPRNELFLSPVSVWEAHRALRAKRFGLKVPFQTWLAEAMAARPMTAAPFTFDVAAEAAALVMPQPDPGDLFIAATAIVHGLTLATADEQLLACRAVKTIPNT